MDMYHQTKKPLKQIVYELLTEKCLGLWHSLYMDNFYNSVELSEDLLADMVYTVGTLQSNRGEPAEISKPSKMKKGEIIAKDNGKVMVLAWMDKRVVKVISTKQHAKVSTIKRRIQGKHGETEEIKKPICMNDYNAHMSGMDQVDQMISYYPCS